MYHRLGLLLPHQTLRSLLLQLLLLHDFPCLPKLFLDKIEETYNIDLFLALYQIITPSELCAAFNIAIFAWLLGTLSLNLCPGN